MKQNETKWRNKWYGMERNETNGTEWDEMEHCETKWNKMEHIATG